MNYYRGADVALAEVERLYITLFKGLSTLPSKARLSFFVLLLLPAAKTTYSLSLFIIVGAKSLGSSSNSLNGVTVLIVFRRSRCTLSSMRMTVVTSPSRLRLWLLKSLLSMGVSV